MHSLSKWSVCTVGVSLLSLSACGGSASDGVDASINDGASTIADLGAGDALTPISHPDGGSAPTSTSIQAATDTATHNIACIGGGAGGKDIRPFYWEIGNANGPIVSGSVTDTGQTTYTATSVMAIASASKWFYSTYWVQRMNAVVTATDIKFFNFWSGYTNFSSCVGSTTVASCLAIAHNGTTNGTLDATTENKFDYGGGHMQVHAASIAGIGALDNVALATEIQSQVGAEIAITYNEPQLAGGIATSAAEYAKLLRKIIGGALVMKNVLGTHPVCVDPASCLEAVSTPSPAGEKWHYAIGHWVEDDPTVGDGAFSSPGAFGFYPWIDSSKIYYGVVARKALGGALTSVYCGRLIRKAWMTGVEQ